MKRRKRKPLRYEFTIAKFVGGFAGAFGTVTIQFGPRPTIPKKHRAMSSGRLFW